MTNTENHFIVEPETLAPTFEVGVRGMDCASCAQMLERSLAQLEGLEHVEVNFATARLRATGRVDRDAIARRVRALGYDLDDEPAAPGAEQVEPDGRAEQAASSATCSRSGIQCWRSSRQGCWPSPR